MLVTAVSDLVGGMGPVRVERTSKSDESRSAQDSRALGRPEQIHVPLPWSDDLKRTQTRVFTTFLIYIFINRSRDKIAQETLTKYKVISSAYTGE